MDYSRHDREREENRLRAIARRAQIEQQEWEREHVDFSPMGSRRSRPSSSLRSRPKAVANLAALKERMSEDEVENLLGRAQTRNTSEVAGLPMINATYDLPETTVTAQFVNGVLAKFAIATK